MTAPLPRQRPWPGRLPMTIGKPVSTREWANMGALATWLAAKGACLVPYTRLADPGDLSDSTAITYRFRVRPRATALQRVWLIDVEGDSSAGDPPYTMKVNGGASMTGRGDYVETVSSPSAELTELTLELTAPEGGVIYPRGVAVYEQDRPALDVSTGEGVDIASLRSSQPIAASITGVSLGGIYAVPIDPRRSGMAHLALGIVGSTVNGKSGTGYDTLTPLPLPMLAQVVRDGATEGDVYVTAYARMTATGTGHIRLTRTSDSATTVIDVTGTSWGWTTPVAVAVDADDMSAADGLRGAAFDGLSVEIEGASGSTIEVQTISFLGDSLA